MADQRPCPAPGCQTLVPRSKAFCRSHWFALPKPLRDAIWAAYRGGDKRALAENHIEARRYLAGREAPDHG